MKRTIIGLTIIAAGVLVLLANINAFNMSAVLDNWWPAFLVVGGGLVLLSDTKNYPWAIALSGFGTILLLNNNNVTDINIGDLILPTILVMIGLSVLRANSSRSWMNKSTGEDINALLSGSSTRNTSSDYTGSNLTAIMGGIELDLSKATIKKTATIRVNVLMGGIDLRVADDVVVKSRASVLLGGVEDKSVPAQTKNAPTLYIEGSVVMGGIEVKR
jgi:predicted membrane protein